MPADPSTIPASGTATNLLVEPLGVAGLRTFAAGETRVVDFSAFPLAQRSVVWNACFRAVDKNLLASPDITFEVTDLATGQQATQNLGGQGTGVVFKPVAGGLYLPATIVVTNLTAELLSITGIASPIPPLGVFTLDTTAMPINQQAAVWNALVRARDLSLISSPQLTTAVDAGFTGHQGVDNDGGQSDGGDITVLVETPPVLPINISAPVISGTAAVGSTLASSTGAWTGVLAGDFTYQWKRAGVVIAGATASTYALISLDLGAAIACVVTATNTVGSTSATSNTVDVSHVPSADEWEARIIANGGTLLPAAKTAAAVFIQTIDALGIWPNIDRLNLFAGSDGDANQNLAGALVPLVNRLGDAVDTFTNGGTANYAVANGIISNGSCYVRTGAIPRSALGGLLLAINTGASTGNRTIMGCAQTSNSTSCRYYAPPTSSHRGGDWGTSGLGTTGGVGGYTGCHVVRRRTLTDLARIRNGALMQGNAAPSADAVPAYPMYVLSSNANGSPTIAVPTGHRIGGYWMHTGVVDDGVFPSAVWSAVRDALATFYASLGRTLA